MHCGHTRSLQGPATHSLLYMQCSQRRHPARCSPGWSGLVRQQACTDHAGIACPAGLHSSKPEPGRPVTPASCCREAAGTCSATSRVSRAGYLLWCQSSGCEPHVQQTCPLQASARPSESNSNKAEAGRTVVLVKARPPSGGGGNCGKGSAGKAGKGPASDGAAGEAEVIEGAPRKVSTLWADVVAMQDV